MKKALINTAKGAMTVELYEKEAPGTVANFVKLSKQGYYNGLAFHRVIPSFVIQGGCPYSVDMKDPRVGTGGPGYSINCELDGDKQYHDRGVLSMAHSGRNTGGSQFFICHNRQNTKHLDRNHTCFGIVTDGIDIVDTISPGDIIKSIEIIED
jgi:peptidyl-prolyl cis-trans isomerase B (cyclophilin B)